MLLLVRPTLLAACRLFVLSCFLERFKSVVRMQRKRHKNKKKMGMILHR